MKKIILMLIGLMTMTATAQQNQLLKLEQVGQCLAFKNVVKYEPKCFPCFGKIYTYQGYKLNLVYKNTVNGKIESQQKTYHGINPNSSMIAQFKQQCELEQKTYVQHMNSPDGTSGGQSNIITLTGSVSRMVVYGNLDHASCRYLSAAKSKTDEQIFTEARSLIAAHGYDPKGYFELKPYVPNPQIGVGCNKPEYTTVTESYSVIYYFRAAQPF